MMRSHILMLLVLLVSSGVVAHPEPIQATDYSSASQGHIKPGAKIGLEQAQVNLEVSGVEYAIELRLINGYDGAKVSLDINASEGLFILEGDLNPSQVLGRGITSFPLTVSATAPGLYYIYINAQVEKEGIAKTGRALTFIVEVGGGEADGASQKSAKPVPEVHSMPAKEEIFR